MVRFFKGFSGPIVIPSGVSAIDTPEVPESFSWATFDGTGKKLHMTGDSDEPPYPTGLDALLDGWRLFQASQAIPEHPGQEFRTSYLKHEFFFEKLEEGDF